MFPRRSGWVGEEGSRIGGRTEIKVSDSTIYQLYIILSEPAYRISISSLSHTFKLFLIFRYHDRQGCLIPTHQHYQGEDRQHGGIDITLNLGRIADLPRCWRIGGKQTIKQSTVSRCQVMWSDSEADDCPSHAHWSARLQIMVYTIQEMLIWDNFLCQSLKFLLVYWLVMQLRMPSCD